MVPAPVEGHLARRYCDIYGCYSSNSTWDNWGRWVALVFIVIFFLLLGVLFSSRRRRQRGMAPMYGTGWMAGKPPTGQQHNGGWGGQHDNGAWAGQQHYSAPPPPYMGHQATGTTFQSHDGYYGNHNSNPYGQQGGIELQSPGASYQPQRGGEPVYEAPMGPPPGKGDGVIR